MKKIAGILAAVLLVTALGGCYKSETTLDFNASGGVEVTSVLLASPEMYEAAGVADADALIETFSEETLDLYASMYGMKETGERIEMTRVDAEEAGMSGALLRMQYKNVTDLTSSFTLLNFLRATPLVEDGAGNGLKIEEERTLFGTRYTGSGKINLFVGDDYKTEYDTADEATKAKISEAAASITFKFPLAFSKSNADKAGLFGSSLTWAVTAEAPEKEVYFTATAINPVIFGMAIAILILLIVLIVVLRKKNAGPDAYFIDEEGNAIPVFDEEEEAFDEEEEFELEEGEAEEVVSEEELTETEEIPATESEEEPSAESETEE